METAREKAIRQLEEIEDAIQSYAIGGMAVSTTDSNGQKVEVNRSNVGLLYRRRAELRAKVYGCPVLPSARFHLYR